MNQDRSTADVAGIFITSTEPAVGKTIIGCGLAAALVRRGLRVAVMKPIETGCALRPDARVEVDGMPGTLDAEQLAAMSRLANIAGPPPATHVARVSPDALVPADAMLLARFSGGDAPLDTVNPYRFAPAVAPAVAARLAERPIDLDVIAASLRDLATEVDLVIVEGPPGLLVPLGDKLTAIDLVARLGLPTLLVGPSQPRVINHCLMSLEVLARRDLTCCGVVLNRHTAAPPRPEEAANPEQIEAHAGDVVRGLLPHLDEPERADPDRLARRLHLHVDIASIIAPLGLAYHER